ncbi:DUF4097 family beta strand repeat-containing protein [Streptosporangium roseum]|uniref:DUF4097 family beta strand repeat-containing protein n=1 Tax=Streptosporangium roseum TaxID=2001 RepID=UPI00332847C9
MPTTRTLPAPVDGPITLDLDLKHGAVTVTVADIPRAEIILTTTDPDDSVTAKEINNATITANGNDVRAVVPVRSASGGVHTRIETHQGGRTVVTQFSGNIVNSGVMIGTGTAVFTGKSNGKYSIGQIGGDFGIHLTAGIEAEVRLPAGSSLRMATESTNVTITGELARISYRSISGTLRAGACSDLNASSTSGDVCADVADHVNITTVSGDIRLGRTEQVEASSTSGDISIGDFGGMATLKTVSGDISAHATDGGNLTATSVSGDIRVTAASGVADAEGEDRLIVAARSISGDVSTPRPTAAISHRPRRPRRASFEA